MHRVSVPLLTGPRNWEKLPSIPCSAVQHATYRDSGTHHENPLYCYCEGWYWSSLCLGENASICRMNSHKHIMLPRLYRDTISITAEKRPESTAQSAGRSCP